MISSALSRRSFVHAVTAATLLDRIRPLAAAARQRFKIRDVRTMTLQGPSRTYVPAKVMADDELYGIAEAYGTPGVRGRGTDPVVQTWLARLGSARSGAELDLRR